MYRKIRGNVKIKKKPKIILTKGPYIRYQADLWYLPKELKKIIIIYISLMFSIILVNGLKIIC